MCLVVGFWCCLHESFDFEQLLIWVHFLFSSKQSLLCLRGDKYNFIFFRFSLYSISIMDSITLSGQGCVQAEMRQGLARAPATNMFCCTNFKNQSFAICLLSIFLMLNKFIKIVFLYLTDIFNTCSHSTPCLHSICTFPLCIHYVKKSNSWNNSESIG